MECWLGDTVRKWAGTASWTKARNSMQCRCTHGRCRVADVEWQMSSGRCRVADVVEISEKSMGALPAIIIRDYDGCAYSVCYFQVIMVTPAVHLAVHDITCTASDNGDTCSVPVLPVSS